MGLCFGFGLKTVLVGRGMFSLLLSSAYTEPRPLQVKAPHTTLPESGLGCPRSCEKTQEGQLTSTDQRGIPYNMMSRSAIKAVEEGEIRGVDVREL